MKNGRIRPYEPILMSLHRVGDASLGLCLFLCLAWLYGMYNHTYPIVAIIILFIALFTFRFVGLYRSWRVASFRHEFHQIILGCIAVYILLLLVGYSLKASHLFSRRVVLTWMISWPILLGAERFAIRTVLSYLREKGHNIRTAVVAGAGKTGEELVRYIDENLWSGAKIEGFFDDEGKGPIKGYRVLGPLKDLPSFVRDHEIDIVYLALPMKAEEKIQWILKELADTTTSVYLIPDIFLFDVLLGGNVLYFNGMPAIALRDTPMLGFHGLIKRLEDLAFSSMVLLFASPVMLAVAIAIKLTSPGPVFFKQWRYGLDGHPICIYKFRTMTVCEDESDFKQATRDDPRVTPLGAFLRRTSLDELPQFMNVLQGRMSIVGPRPHPVTLNEQYRKLVPGYMLRHKVRPGITGLAQIKGWRGETDTLEKMEKRIEFDLEYLREWSLLLDLKIIFLTLINGTWKTNAY